MTLTPLEETLKHILKAVFIIVTNPRVSYGVKVKSISDLLESYRKEFEG